METGTRVEKLNRNLRENSQTKSLLLSSLYMIQAKQQTSHPRGTASQRSVRNNQPIIRAGRSIIHAFGTSRQSIRLRNSPVEVLLSPELVVWFLRDADDPVDDFLSEARDRSIRFRSIARRVHPAADPDFRFLRSDALLLRPGVCVPVVFRPTGPPPFRTVFLLLP